MRTVAAPHPPDLPVAAPRLLAMAFQQAQLANQSLDSRLPIVQGVFKLPNICQLGRRFGPFGNAAFQHRGVGHQSLGKIQSQQSDLMASPRAFMLVSSSARKRIFSASKKHN